MSDEYNDIRQALQNRKLSGEAADCMIESYETANNIEGLRRELLGDA